MHIEFAAGDAGFREAWALARIARLVQEYGAVGSAEVQLLDTLLALGDAHIARPEFAELRAAMGDVEDGIEEGAGDGFWRSLFGPSRREVMLSEQRSAALERAERAERSAFEALAETARVARERDEALARLAARDDVPRDKPA
ncbi:MAG: hypothetical protein H6977_05415 [Gammaproteobacteria bacterium]|nr:hypothetical protein [Gammaproteobacteria bacterium]MCP5199427.1 hypothetical protein [Gammaproteobacteria bacterium]